MVTVDEVEFTLDLLALFHKSLAFPEVRLTRPAVFLELATDGRKSWLLDLEQSDEAARVPIGRLTLDHGQLGYEDPRQQTSVLAEISTQNPPIGNSEAAGVVFAARGLYKSLVFSARGHAGSVLALNDESVPYPLKVEANIGKTSIKADGSVTSLLKLTALDMHATLHGESLAALFPLLGIALPETHPYATEGRIVRSGKSWRYEKFSGRVGKSDIAGSLQVDADGARPFMHGELMSQLLDFDDLGPVIGMKDKPLAAVRQRMLPDIPFKTERWGSIDADVTLRAKTIARAKELPLENLVTHLKMQNSTLTLDPLDFGLAGGHLKAAISLDGHQNPIQAKAKITARQIQLAKLFPTVTLTQASVGQVNGEIDLTGKGNSVGDMLGSANGRVGLVVASGQISKLLMEQVGLHLLEILELSLAGDKNINLRCAVADFSVKNGVLETSALILDTDVTTITGQGSIDLGREQLDLTLEPKTRNTSLVALRSPIYVKGTFSRPEITIDKARVAARGGVAIALGIVNPLLALIPLVEAGPGIQSDCGQLITQANAPLQKTPAHRRPASSP